MRNAGISEITGLVISKLLALIVLLSFHHSAYSQNGNNDVRIFFIKGSDSLRTSDLYFNVLNIVNNSGKPVIGELTIDGPENWRIITVPLKQITLNQGDTIRIPVRVSASADALGGISYIIGATLRTSERIISANTYLVLPSKPKWDFSINNESIFFTELSEFTDFAVTISNKGNTNELIKLELDIGKLLMLPESKGNEHTVFVDVPAYSDTTLRFNITYQKELSYAERSRYENSWIESTVVVTASSEKTEKSAAISITKLKSSIFNPRDQLTSPLNIDYEVYNIMSNQKARFNARAYGNLLFEKNRELYYMAGVQNIYFDYSGNEQFNINNQLQYALHYTDNRNDILFGYNIYGGDLHTVNGRGITGRFLINPTNSISYALTQNPFNRNIGEHLGYATTIGGISVNASITNENDNLGIYSATSVQAGAGVNFLDHHQVSLQLLGSRTVFQKPAPETGDTVANGYSYRVTYRAKYKDFDFRISGLNSINNYIRNSGMQQLYVDSKYTLNPKVAFNLYGNHQYYAVTRYPYNFYNPVNFNSNDFFRITSSISQGNILYQAGPNYVGSMRQYFDPVSGFKSKYITYQPGIWASATFRLNGFRSISPNLTLSNLRFHYETEDPGAQDFSWTGNFYYSAGLNYYDDSWKINAYYSSGTTADLYRNIQVSEKPVVSRSIQVRPTYERYFFDKKVKLTAYINYSYYMPSQRENINYSLRYEQFMKKGWSIYLNGFLYSNTRVNEEIGRINGKDLNLIAGVTKSFDIQQPRLKYYDLKAVFFNDLDGNRIKSENEPPVGNILVSIEKDRTLSIEPSSIPIIEMISDLNGEIFFENLPKDHYKLTFTPLVNLESLYFLDGSEQTFFNEKKGTLYIPLAESYRIRGKIVVVRDPNSNEGKISLGGIRITAVGSSGNTYSVLSDKNGSYVLSIPKADRYTVRVNNVFGEQFSIDRDQIEIQFAQNRTINIDFVFLEKRREIRFNSGTGSQRFNFVQGSSR